MEDTTKKHIITISGMLGAGKSTTAKQLAEELGYLHFSSGDLMRAIGKEHGIDDIRQVNLENEKDHKFDYVVDERLRQIGKNENEIIIKPHFLFSPFIWPNKNPFCPKPDLHYAFGQSRRIQRRCKSSGIQSVRRTHYFERRQQRSDLSG